MLGIDFCVSIKPPYIYDSMAGTKKYLNHQFFLVEEDKLQGNLVGVKFIDKVYDKNRVIDSDNDYEIQLVTLGRLPLNLTRPYSVLHALQIASDLS